MAYDFEVRGDGPWVGGLAGARGRVAVVRLEGDEHSFRARIEGVLADGDAFLVVRDGDTVRSLDPAGSAVWSASLFAGGSELLQPVQAALLYELIDPANLAGAANAAHLDSGEVRHDLAAPCRMASVPAEGGGRVAWCLGLDDGLPRLRRVDSPGGGAELRLSGLALDPALDDATFDLPTPEGYRLRRASAGPPPGSPAPDFELPAPGGGTVSLASLAGSAVVLDFWATWCRPCVPSLAGLERLADELADPRLAVFAVNARETADPTGFLDGAGIDLPLLAEGDRLLEIYSGGVLPAFAVIDPAGRVTGTGVGYFGAGSDRYLRSLVERALAAPPG